jgi:hypothetical protein
LRVTAGDRTGHGDGYTALSAILSNNESTDDTPNRSGSDLYGADEDVWRRLYERDIEMGMIVEQLGDGPLAGATRRRASGMGQ